MKPDEIQINQIGLIVENLEEKVKELERIGVGPFNIIEAHNVEISYRGENSKVDMKIAIANIGNIQVELIEAKGKSFYTDFLRERGEGLNHLGIFVKDIDKAFKKYSDLGYGILQSGIIYGVKWIYLDTIEKLGFVLELIEVP